MPTRSYSARPCAARCARAATSTWQSNSARARRATCTPSAGSPPGWSRRRGGPSRPAGRGPATRRLPCVPRWSRPDRARPLPDPRLSGFPRRLLGDAFTTPLAVKQKYDPNNSFHFDQSIWPPPSTAGVRRSTAPSFFAPSPTVRHAPARRG
ncbi:MAG: BBE domain-containing protein [Candidatus Rokubacteria bacterium]|nr:BBE domain-containing protein [Candidatus Rokubacteria bacterium]